MSKHTAGPQWYARQTVSGNWDIADEMSGKTIARTEEAATAHLIEAAPEMLEALQHMVRQIEEVYPQASTLSYGRAAIAKADGRADA